jgi:hypothetical protein
MRYANTHAQEHITVFWYIYGRSHEQTKIQYTHKHAHTFTKIMHYARRQVHKAYYMILVHILACSCAYQNPHTKIMQYAQIRVM